MVNFLSVLIALFSINSFAAVVPSGVPSLTVGITGTAPAGQGSAAASGKIFGLYFGAPQTLTAGNVAPLLKDGTAYQVPALTSAYCTGSYYSDATGGSFQLMSATASFAFNATPGSLTGAVYQLGASARYLYRVTIAGQINEFLPMGGMYSFKAGTYAGVQGEGSTNQAVILNCFEQLD